MRAIVDLRLPNEHDDWAYTGDRVHILAPDEGKRGLVPVWDFRVQRVSQPELAADGPYYFEEASYLYMAHYLLFDLMGYMFLDEVGENLMDITTALRELYYDYLETVGRSDKNATRITEA